MAAQMTQQQHNNGQNALSSQSNIPGSYEHSQVTPSGAHDELVSRPVLDADSRLVPSASISDRNDDILMGVQNKHYGVCDLEVAGSFDKKDQVTSHSTEPPGRDSARLRETGAQAVDPGLENIQVNQSEHSFPPASVGDCIAPADNLCRSDSENKLDIEDETLQENKDEQSGGNLGAPRVDHVGVSLLPTLQMVQPDRVDDEPTGLVNDVRPFSIRSCENQPQGDLPFADDTQGRRFSSTTSSSQDKGTLASNLHFSDGVIGLASLSAATNLVSQILQPYAQRTTDRDQVLEQLSSENAPVIDHNAGRAEHVPVFHQPEFDQDDVAQGHFDGDLSENVPLDDEHVDSALRYAQPSNSIQQPEILEFDRNDDIDLAQARAERNHDAQARPSRRRQYFMNADGVIDICLARQEWILGHRCLSCRENNREVMMVPCGHSVLCWSCFLEASRFHDQINRCPRCMQPTSGIKLSQDCYRKVLQYSQ